MGNAVLLNDFKGDQSVLCELHMIALVFEKIFECSEISLSSSTTRIIFVPGLVIVQCPFLEARNRTCYSNFTRNTNCAAVKFHNPLTDKKSEAKSASSLLSVRAASHKRIK